MNTLTSIDELGFAQALPTEALEDTTSDHALLEATRSGDQDAFAELVNRYRNQITSYIYRMTNDYDGAVDLAQETFVRAWQAADGFDVERDPAAWLATISKRAAIDIHRREARRPATGLIDLAADDPAVVTLPPDLGSVDAVWQVRRAIDQLQPDEATIIRMHHLDGMTHTQIADRLGVALGTVKSRSHRAHAKLASLLGHLTETVA